MSRPSTPLAGATPLVVWKLRTAACVIGAELAVLDQRAAPTPAPGSACAAPASPPRRASRPAARLRRRHRARGGTLALQQRAPRRPGCRRRAGSRAADAPASPPRRAAPQAAAPACAPCGCAQSQPPIDDQPPARAPAPDVVHPPGRRRLHDRAPDASSPAVPRDVSGRSPGEESGGHHPKPRRQQDAHLSLARGLRRRGRGGIPSDRGCGDLGRGVRGSGREGTGQRADAGVQLDPVHARPSATSSRAPTSRTPSTAGSSTAVATASSSGSRPTAAATAARPKAHRGAQAGRASAATPPPSIAKGATANKNIAIGVEPAGGENPPDDEFKLVVHVDGKADGDLRQRHHQGGRQQRRDQGQRRLEADQPRGDQPGERDSRRSRRASRPGRAGAGAGASVDRQPGRRRLRRRRRATAPASAGWRRSTRSRWSRYPTWPRRSSTARSTWRPSRPCSSG